MRKKRRGKKKLQKEKYLKPPRIKSLDEYIHFLTEIQKLFPAFTYPEEKTITRNNKL